MRFSLLSRLFYACALSVLLAVAAFADVPAGEFAKMLPARVGNFKAAGALDLKFKQKAPEFINPSLLEGAPLAARSYVSASGEKFDVQLYRTQSDAAAYSLLGNARLTQAAKSPADVKSLEGVGTVAIRGRNSVSFYKGAAFVHVESSGLTDGSELVSFARSLAESLDAGAGEIPVLVKHLPDWETAQERAAYAVSLPALQEVAGNRPALDAVSFEGGTEAVTTTYDPGARLVIVEYATPQIAFDGDAAIKTRIAALPGEGKPVPSAYKRVGNYGVFVFDAPDERVANDLIGKVTYEKDVRWLGENPYAVERANRAWLNMSTSVIVNTVKATGLAIVICLSIGGIFGGWIFTRRRAQAALTEKFSDAGGMLRLNIDELSTQNNPGRLIGQGDK